MGGCEFFDEITGPTAEAAFNSAHDNAQWEHGHSGYTGTIAEKGSFVIFDLPEGFKPYDYAERAIEGDESVPRHLREAAQDKYGPACCFQLAPDRWLFFGWAAS